jgi:hypothetical protein
MTSQLTVYGVVVNVAPSVSTQGASDCPGDEEWAMSASTWAVVLLCMVGATSLALTMRDIARDLRGRR